MLLSVPRGFEPEAADEIAELLDASVVDRIGVYPTFGLIEVVVLGQRCLQDCIPRCCHLLSLRAAHVLLDRRPADLDALNDASQQDAQQRLVGLMSAGRHAEDWAPALSAWQHCRHAGLCDAHCAPLPPAAAAEAAPRRRPSPIPRSLARSACRRRAAGLVSDPLACTFRATFDKLGSSFAGLTTMDFEAALGEGGWRERGAGEGRVA